MSARLLRGELIRIKPKAGFRRLSLSGHSAESV